MEEEGEGETGGGNRRGKEEEDEGRKTGNSILISKIIIFHSS